jgi:hypothetical protein
MNTPWTPQEDELILKMTSPVTTDNQISIALKNRLGINRTAQAVSARRRRLGFEQRSTGSKNPRLRHLMAEKIFTWMYPDEDYKPTYFFSLTMAETETLKYLKLAHEAYVQEHPEDYEEFTRRVQELQRMIAFQAAYRTDPKLFANLSREVNYDLYTSKTGLTPPSKKT